MEKITIQIEGMMCGMCEAHINETIRNAFPSAKKAALLRFTIFFQRTNTAIWNL